MWHLGFAFCEGQLRTFGRKGSEGTILARLYGVPEMLAIPWWLGDW